MFIRVLGFLLLVFLPLKVIANPAIAFSPNFNGLSVPMTAGTNILPLCSSPLDPLCVNQWSQQAMPLALHPSAMGAMPQYQYFLPSFVPSGFVDSSPIDDENWKFWMPDSYSSSYSSRRRRDRESRDESSKEEEKKTVAQRVFYRSTSHPNKIRIVETDEKGQQVIKELVAGLNSEEDIKKAKLINESPVGNLSWEVYKPSFRTKTATPSQAIYVNTSNPDQLRVLTTDETGKQTVQKGTVNLISEEDITATDSGTYIVEEDTQALPATTREVQPGCVIVDKAEETEAGFCFECAENEQDNSILNALSESEGFWDGIRNFLSEVVGKSIRRVASKISSLGDNIQKICHPETSLRAIINNFERTCPEPYKNNFKKFFEESYCKSCEKGIPPEVMMAMMSIESAGECTASAGNSREQSEGLFQINSKVHQCQDSGGTTHPENTAFNSRCLKDPVNNLNSGIDILFDHYKQVNATEPNASQCKSWNEISPAEQDRWRRGVSAYNGGPEWVKRAIHSVIDPNTLNSTDHLRGLRAVNFRSSSAFRRHLRESIPWEDLRAYYFVEKLSPTNIRGTGRRNDFTVSNLAHTEAVLGRNVESSSPAMVDIWAQYRNNNQVSCPQ